MFTTAAYTSLSRTCRSIPRTSNEEKQVDRERRLHGDAATLAVLYRFMLSEFICIGYDTSLNQYSHLHKYVIRSRCSICYPLEIFHGCTCEERYATKMQISGLFSFCI